MTMKSPTPSPLVKNISLHWLQGIFETVPKCPISTCPGHLTMCIVCAASLWTQLSSHNLRSGKSLRPVPCLAGSAFRTCSEDGRWLGRLVGDFHSMPQGWTNYTPCYTKESFDLYERLFGPMKSKVRNSS